jgi:hypothetical protein
VGSFNEVIALDMFYLLDAQGVSWNSHSTLDLSGKLHVVVKIENREPAHLLEKLRLSCLVWAGPPKIVLCDRDGGYRGEFHDALVKMGVDVRPIPADAHWQAGRVERQQQTWKHMARRVITALQLVGASEMDQLTVEVNHAKNSMVRQAGYSPHQWTFGKEIELPEGILARPDAHGAHQGLSEEGEFGRRALMRLEARKGFLDYDLAVALKRATLRQSRPYRGNYEPGEKVLYFRKQFRTKRGRGRLFRRIGGQVR